MKGYTKEDSSAYLAKKAFFDKVLTIYGRNTVMEALEDEALARANARRSLVSGRNIPKGKIIESEDLTFKRPAYGISPKFIDEIVGKKALDNIEEDSVLQWSMFGS